MRLTLPRAQFNIDVDLRLPAQGITMLFGASGSGKTSILRCVAGLEHAATGTVCIGNEIWQDDRQGVFLPTWRRPLGYVFQESSLFEHLNVRRNLEYGLRRSGRASGRETLEEAVELLGIRSLLDRRPALLSGGERQRVAIARALATRPRLLLLDEPLASIDQPRRREIMPWLERLRDQLAIPMLYVTHSVDELSRLADHVVILDGGRIAAEGSAGEVLAKGSLPALAGEEISTVIEGTIAELDERWLLARVKLAQRSLLVRNEGLPPGSRVRLRVQARDVSLALDEPSRTSIQNHLPGIVEAIMPDAHPAQALVRVRCEGQTLISRVTCKSVEELHIVPQLTVWVQIKSVAIIV
ncbi:molybdenum ABC transporter ATP-binding protein [Parapusillimonas sp. SGNA-6]|nr:molybdenum ABC transporter ATP-binding protein [Parapusillimonas sp. SGNA-6]